MLQIHESRRDKALELLKYAEKEENLYTCIHYMITAIKTLLHPSVEETLETMKKVKDLLCRHPNAPIGTNGRIVCSDCGQDISNL